MIAGKEKGKGRLEREVLRDIVLVEPEKREKVRQLAEKAALSMEANKEAVSNKRRTNKKGADGVDMELE